MRWIIVISLLISLHGYSQNIVLAGEIEKADTVNITVYSEGGVVLTQRVIDPVYALILGDKPSYTILFEWRGNVKRAYLHTYGMKAETINLGVNFSHQTSVVIVKDAGGLLKKWSRNYYQFTYIYYGYHASRKSF